MFFLVMGSGFLLHSRYEMKINSIDWSSAIPFIWREGWVGQVNCYISRYAKTIKTLLSSLNSIKWL